MILDQACAMFKVFTSHVTCSSYLRDIDDLAVGLLQLPELTHEVPVAGLGRHVLRGEYPHPVEGGFGFLLGRVPPPHDVVLL